MKILLIGNLPEDRQESMRRFTELLRDGMRARGHTVSVLTPTLRLARLGPRYRYGGLPKYLGYFDKFVLFPRRLRRHAAATRPDVVHFTDQAGAIYGSSVHAIPTIATCHDLLQIRAARGEIPQQSVNRGGRAYQAWILAGISRCAHIACVSNPTRTDLLRLTEMPPAQVSIVPNALNYPYRPIPPTTARERLAGLSSFFSENEGAGFLLQIGGAQWYKNRAGLLAIYAGLRQRLSPAPSLVMVGPPLSPEHAALAAKLGLNAHLRHFESVTGPQLEALYNAAEGLLFPSLEEGFGWPVAEAQACGCPVFASDRSPMNEVGGRSSIYFDPGDADGAARVIAESWTTRTDRRALALTESLRWQPTLMLEAYDALYRQLIS